MAEGGPREAFKPRWADIADSSQESVKSVEMMVVEPRAAPISQSSYNGLSQDADNRSAGLSAQAAGLQVIDLEATPPQAADVKGGASALAVPMSERLHSWRPKFHEAQLTPSSRRETTRAQPSSPFTPQRRTRQRLEAPTAQRQPLTKRKRKAPGAAPGAPTAPKPAARTPSGPPEAATPAAAEVTAEDMQRRLTKRRTAVAAIKAMPEYERSKELCALGAKALEELPLTPDPETGVSKRTWEASVMSWRAGLRAVTAG